MVSFDTVDCLSHVSAVGRLANELERHRMAVPANLWQCTTRWWAKKKSSTDTDSTHLKRVQSGNSHATLWRCTFVPLFHFAFKFHARIDSCSRLEIMLLNELRKIADATVTAMAIALISTEAEKDKRMRANIERFIALHAFVQLTQASKYICLVI